MQHAVSKVQEPPQRGRQRWMDTLRATAVFLVVLEHAVILTPGELPGAVEHANDLMTPFRIPTLMFLSGMLLHRSLAKPLREYVTGKVSRIAWPFLVWSAVILLVKIPGETPTGIVHSVLLSPQSPMWYLAYLFVFYLVALVLPAGVRPWVIVPALVGAVLVPADGNWERFLCTLAFFLAGDLFARHAGRLTAALRHRSILVPLVVLAVALALASTLGHDVRYKALYAIPTLAGILAAIPAFQWFSTTRVGERISSLGALTIVFYVVSYPAQLVGWHALEAVGAPPVLNMLGNLVIGLGCGHLAAVLQDRFVVLRYLFDLQPRRRTPQEGNAVA